MLRDAGTAINGRKRLTAAERKEKIIAAAVKLFSEKGFSGATTRGLARAARVSEALLYQHFKAKEDLYDAIIDYKMREARADVRADICAAAERGDDRRVLMGVGEDVLSAYRRDPAFIRLLVYSGLEGHSLSQRFFERQVRPYYEFLKRYIKQRQAEGAFRDMDPVAATRAWMGMLNHHGLVRVLFGDPVMTHSSDATVLPKFVSIFLEGMKR
jgi:TetR/AcrR family transcriptional regulator